MTSTPKLVDRPTRRQLAYLRSLAERTGQTFAYPHTRGQASREIQRLEAGAGRDARRALDRAQRDRRRDRPGAQDSVRRRAGRSHRVRL